MSFVIVVFVCLYEDLPLSRCKRFRRRLGGNAAQDGKENSVIKVRNTFISHSLTFWPSGILPCLPSLGTPFKSHMCTMIGFQSLNRMISWVCSGMFFFCWGFPPTSKTETSFIKINLGFIRAPMCVSTVFFILSYRL